MNVFACVELYLGVNVTCPASDHLAYGIEEADVVVVDECRVSKSARTKQYETVG